MDELIEIESFDEIEDSFSLNEDDFSDDFSENEDLQNNQFIKPKKHKHLKQRNIKFQNAHSLVRSIDLQKGEDVFCFLSGNFIFSDFLHGLFTYHNIFAKKMVISTLSFDNYNIGQLKALIENDYIGELTLIVSDYFYSHEKRKAIAYAYEQLTPTGKFQLAVARVHCKMTIFETDKGNKFTIHGSANLRSSDNVEQIHLTQNPSIYDFSLTLFDKIESEFKTLNKSIKTNQLNTF